MKRWCDAPNHIVLVGMMGSGKSTVARILGQRLKRPVLDTDTELELRAGRTVREIFAEDGEAAFRDLEASVLAECLATAEPTVIAAAGGVVLRAENRAALKQAPGACVIWLRAEPGVLVERVMSAGHRPLLDADPAGTLQRMFDERKALYTEVAQRIVSVEQRSALEVAEAILR